MAGDSYLVVVEGLDALMTEAGIEGGRPVRRAIRTLDVCLQLKEGSYLARRHEEGAGRVDSIDFDEWEFEVTTEDGSETFGAVELADNFKPTSEDDFYVMAQFDQEKLQKLLKDDPAKIIQSILASNSTEMDSDELKRILTPKHISNSAWTKWWTKARQGLRNLPSQSCRNSWKSLVDWAQVSLLEFSRVTL